MDAKIIKIDDEYRRKMMGFTPVISDGRPFTPEYFKEKNIPENLWPIFYLGSVNNKQMASIAKASENEDLSSLIENKFGDILFKLIFSWRNLIDFETGIEISFDKNVIETFPQKLKQSLFTQILRNSGLSNEEKVGLESLPDSTVENSAVLTAGVAILPQTI